MTFAARQRELKERLQWAPSRGPKRRAVLDELRALVRDELKRELVPAVEAPPAATEAPPSPDLVASDVPPGPDFVAAGGPYGGATPWWVDR